MADPFLAEIRITGFSFAPRGWAFCNGQVIPLSQNTALFSLLGTTYGGNGSSNFALPDLQARAPLQAGQGPGLSDRVLGQSGGQATVTLQPAELPSHTHALRAAGGAAVTGAPAGSLATASAPVYGPPSDPVAMADAALAPTGEGQPHPNRPPYLALNFVIALQGIFPSRG